MRKIIGYASATPKLIPSFTAQEYLSLCSELHKIDSTTYNKRIDNLLTNFDLEQYRAYRLDQLSTGNIKLVAICAALLHQPPVLLLDEPYSGLDIKRRKTLSDTLIEISSSTQIVIASQNIDEIFKISNVIFLLQSGKIKKKWNIDSSDTLMLEDVKSFL